MKPPTVFLGEMTNPEVETFLKNHHTVIVPTGAVEQHGPHGPLLTDVLIPQEIARRVAHACGVPLCHGLDRVQDAPAQASSDRRERMRNMRVAFVGRPELAGHRAGFADVLESRPRHDRVERAVVRWNTVRH